MTSKKVSKLNPSRNNPQIRCPICKTRYALRKVNVVHRTKAKLMRGDDEEVEKITFFCTHPECDQERTTIVFQ